MFTDGTQNYGLPQWLPNDKPTWLGDMNEAFENIDTNMKRIEDKADAGGVPQSIIDRIVALENSVSAIATKIGSDVITTIGTSITNAIVNLKGAIDNITTQIGTDVITTIGTSITNAIVNLKSLIDNITTSVSAIATKIGSDVITTIGTSITNAIVNLKGAIDNITTQIGNADITGIGTSITNAIVIVNGRINTTVNALDDVLVQIGSDVITTIGTSITNAIVNLKSAIDTITTQIGNTDITGIGTSITNAIVNLNARIEGTIYIGTMTKSSESTNIYQDFTIENIQQYKLIRIKCIVGGVFNDVKVNPTGIGSCIITSIRPSGINTHPNPVSGIIAITALARSINFENGIISNVSAWSTQNLSNPGTWSAYNNEVIEIYGIK